jgi:small subunit ribosomal protein S20
MRQRLARNAKIAYYARSFHATPTPPFGSLLLYEASASVLANSNSTIDGGARDGADREQGTEFMANTAQTRKRARQAEATRQRNASLKSALRTAVKKVKKAIAAGDKAGATTTLRGSQAVIDRIADKRIVHKNLASRTKSRLAQAIKALP